MNIIKYLGILGVALLAFTQTSAAQNTGFRFLATGDLPYAKNQDVKFPAAPETIGK